MIQVNVQLDSSFSDWKLPLTGSCRSQKPENTIIGYAVIQVHSLVGEKRRIIQALQRSCYLQIELQGTPSWLPSSEDWPHWCR